MFVNNLHNLLMYNVISKETPKVNTFKDIFLINTKN